MAVDKVCISLPPETLAQMDYLRKHLGLTPTIKRSQLIQQIIFDAYARAIAVDQLPVPDDVVDYIL